MRARWILTLLLATAVVLAGVALGPPPAGAAPGTPMPSGLGAGQSIRSPNGRYLLVMQADGNLVVYGPGGAEWSTGTFRPGSTVRQQADGNVVVYDAAGRALWHTVTYGSPGARLYVQDDGNLVIYDAGGVARWDRKGYTGNTGRALDLGPTRITGLTPGQTAVSANGRYRLVMQTDGNLVLYEGGRALWATSTYAGGASLVAQPDGNHVIYAGGVARWSTGSYGHANAAMYLQDDGNLVVYSADGMPRWSRFGMAPLSVQTVLGGLSIPWDVGFLADGTMAVTLRDGRLILRAPSGVAGVTVSVDVAVSGEAGFMGLAVDPSAPNRLYTCQTSTVAGGRTGQIHGWTVQGLQAVRDAAPILSGLPTNTFHLGCQLEFGADGHLWVGTGDAGSATAPQDPGSLGGKVLRITRTGAAAPGNPNGYRWVSRGHRNVQGLAVQPGTGLVYAVEHGPDRDDEVTPVALGQNAGWDPRGSAGSTSYNQSVPMTDLQRYPGAARPVWASGVPTIASSGATFLHGPQWGRWEGAMVMAALKGTQLRVLRVQGGTRLSEELLLGGPGTGTPRLRAAVQGPDGALYVTTSNGGGNDSVLRITRNHD